MGQRTVGSTAVWVALALLAMSPVPVAAQSLGSWQADVDTLMALVAAEHPDPFRWTSEASLDSAAAAVRASMVEGTPGERLVGLARLLAHLGPGNGHSRIRSSPVLDRSVPLRFYRFAEGTFVVAAAPEQGELAGARLLAVAGVTVDSLYDLLADVVAADNEATRWQRVPLLYSLPAVLVGAGVVEAETVGRGWIPMTFRLDGRSVERRVGLAPHDGSWIDDWEDFAPWFTDEAWVFANEGAAAPLPVYLEYTEHPRHRLALLHGGTTLWAQINAVHDGADRTLAQFALALMERARSEQPARIVIDLRHNGGGNGLLTRELIRQLSASEWDAPDRLFVVIGRTTYSAAGFLAAELDYWTDATFVGEPTGARPNMWGDAPRFTLPTGTVVSIAGLYWQKGLAFDTEEWIAPDLHVAPRFSAFRANRDPALEVIARDEGRFEERLAGAARRGKTAVLELIRGADADPLFTYVAPAPTAFELADDRLANGDPGTAVPLLVAVTELAPGFAIVWERLGDAHAALGDPVAAAAAYREALALDPDRPQVRARLDALDP